MRFLFINDRGFQFGAGMAHLRQIQSLLLLGHEVAAFCRHTSVEEQTAAFGPIPPSGWRGLREFRELDFDRGRDDPATTSVLIDAARRFGPDAIVVGNLHGAGWPVSLLSDLKGAGFTVVAFMHDGYLVSGRCAYPGECRLYETGCDETCPTPDQYPALEPAKIPAAWRLRRKVFGGAQGVALAANSGWTLDLARRSLPDLRHSAVLYYGLDERLFRPIDRALARRLLGVPDDRPVIVVGAVDLADRRKGGSAVRAVLAALRGRAHFLAFGRAGAELGDVQSTGLLRDFRRMPLVYSAGDLFLGTSIEEAFGQTFCEAAACGLPSVGFRVGGVPEIARHGVNARLVDAGDVEGLVAEVDLLLRDTAARADMGRAGRALVEAEFTLRRQGERWMDFLRALPAA